MRASRQEQRRFTPPERMRAMLAGACSSATSGLALVDLKTCRRRAVREGEAAGGTGV